VKRVLLIGGSGQLGTAIRQRWRDCEIVAPPRDALDLARAEQLCEAIGRERPDVLVNAAAFHEVDRCEEDPALAFEINALAVARAARLANEHDVVFITISTDYVFNGAASVPYSEDDAVHPISVYGASKLAGEYLVECFNPRAIVVRTCGLYGRATASRRRPFIERVLTHDPQAAPLRVVADVVASPTFAGDLADVLRRLIETESFGLYHAAGAGAVSWYAFAGEALAQAGIATTLEPIAAEQWAARAKRPRFSALENAKLARAGITMPSWRAGIAAYLAHRVR
jgi:dTDP-4-dehydrorhamnose reductase